MKNPPGLESGALWPSFYSGLAPGRHGAYRTNYRFDPTTYREQVLGPDDLGFEPFWTPLSRAQRRVAIIDAPYVFLDDTINGVQLVNWGTHDRVGDFRLQIRPPALAERIVERFGVDPFGSEDVVPCEAHPLRSAADFATFRDRLLDRIARKTEMMTYFLAKEDWDLFLGTFSDAHCAGHSLWHLNDQGHPDHDASLAREVGNPLKDVYIGLDAALGEIMAQVPPDRLTLVYCSHGIGPAYGGSILLDEILMHLDGMAPSESRGRGIAILRAIWRRLPPGLRSAFMPLRQKTWEDYFQAQRRLPERRYFEEFCDNATGWVRINLIGREAHGRVKPGQEYDDLCAQLAADLSQVVNRDSGRPIVRRVLRTAEVYSGPYAPTFPDLLLLWNRGTPIDRVHSPKLGNLERRHKTGRSGDHMPVGLFFASAPWIKPARLPGSVAVTDFAPTIAELLALPSPDFDGQAIRAICPPQGAAAGS